MARRGCDTGIVDRDDAPAASGGLPGCRPAIAGPRDEGGSGAVASVRLSRPEIFDARRKVPDGPIVQWMAQMRSR